LALWFHPVFGNYRRAAAAGQKQTRRRAIAKSIARTVRKSTRAKTRPTGATVAGYAAGPGKQALLPRVATAFAGTAGALRQRTNIARRRAKREKRRADHRSQEAEVGNRGDTLPRQGMSDKLEIVWRVCEWLAV
jgi:hypothetical protein